MPEPYSTHHLALRPDRRIIVLRDIDCDADPGARTARLQARTTIGASSGYGFYIQAVQELVPISVDVEVWQDEPSNTPDDTSWYGPVRCDLDCPSGQLLVGDTIGGAIDGINPPQGPGRYAVTFYHHGRQEIDQVHRQLLQWRLDETDVRVRNLQQDSEGLERYLIRIWWQTNLPDDDEDDDFS
jgi:hypothetical protein